MSVAERRSPGLRAILAYKTIKAPLMLGLAIWLTFSSRTALGSAAWIARELAEGGAVWSRLADWITAHLTRTRIRELAIVAWVDAFVTALEVVLLLTGRPWGEWLVLLGLGALIPLEIVSLDRHPGWVKVIVLAVNTAIVVVLARRRVRETRARRRARTKRRRLRPAADGG